MDDRVAVPVDVPLVVDLEGSFLKSDVFREALIHSFARRPLRAARALFATHGIASSRAAVVDLVIPYARMAPVNEAVSEVIRQARKDGRRVYLATGVDKHLAQMVAKSLGDFDGVFAPENGTDLKGESRARCLVTALGAHGFDYVGNAAVDVPVWRVARKSMIAGATSGVVDRVKREVQDTIILDQPASIVKPCWEALRPHQWIKNILVGLPAIAGHDFSLDALISVLVAFACFSLGASSMYLINDALDIYNDRAHSTKRHRPLAAGLLSLSHVAILCSVLVMASIALAVVLSQEFAVVLIGYFGLTLSYSFYLKRKLMIDVVTLAALYGIRVVAGGVATGIALSHWLVGFCFFIFLSLALMKRATEILRQPQSSIEKIMGRGYRREDLAILNALLAASGFVAVLILALYINSPDVKLLYRRPDLLWGICVVLVYWLGRAFFLTGRGEMRQDPVIFAATDRISWLSGALVAAVFVCAL